MGGPSQAQRHRVLTAVTHLQSLAGGAAGGGADETEALRTGSWEEVHRHGLDLARSWRSVCVVRCGQSQADLHAVLPLLRTLRESGTVVTAAFDVESLTPAATNLVLAEEGYGYHLTYAPLSMTIGDGRSVLLAEEGPDATGEWTLLRLTDPAVVTAALDYWTTVSHAAGQEPPAPAVPDHEDLTERQLRILQHLSAGLTDEHIAHLLEVSVRTVRTDVRAAMDLLGATSRFEAGCAFAGLGPAVG